MTSTNASELRKALDRRILKLLETMWSYEDAALAFTDPEGVHQMRVSSRKLLSALDASRDIRNGKRVRKVRSAAEPEPGLRQDVPAPVVQILEAEQHDGRGHVGNTRQRRREAPVDSVAMPGRDRRPAPAALTTHRADRTDVRYREPPLAGTLSDGWPKRGSAIYAAVVIAIPGVTRGPPPDL